MGVRKPLIDFIQNQLGPADMVALMYPLTPVADIRFSRDTGALMGAIERFEGRKFDYRPRNPFEEQYAFYPAGDGGAHPQSNHHGRAQGCRHPDGRSSRGPQVDDLRQRGIHRVRCRHS